MDIAQVQVMEVTEPYMSSSACNKPPTRKATVSSEKIPLQGGLCGQGLSHQDRLQVSSLH